MKSNRKLRSTEPRRIILEELRKVTTHPTTDEIYNMVRERLPRVSLGTIYRNLDIMSVTGKVMKLEMAGTQRRYDGTTENHYHIRCTNCGRVDDLSLKPLQDLDRQASEVSAYELSGHRLEFMGICPACKSKCGNKAAAY